VLSALVIMRGTELIADFWSIIIYSYTWVLRVFIWYIYYICIDAWASSCSWDENSGSGTLEEVVCTKMLEIHDDGARYIHKKDHWIYNWDAMISEYKNIFASYHQFRFFWSNWAVYSCIMYEFKTQFVWIKLAWIKHNSASDLEKRMNKSWFMNPDD
jgi:hypothetical protein